MRHFWLAVSTGLLVGLVASESHAQWSYSRYSGTVFPGPVNNAFNLGSPVTSYYPTNNFTAGFYTMNSIVSPTDTGYYGAVQNSYFYPIPTSTANSAALLEALSSLGPRSGGLVSASGTTRYAYAPALGLPAGRSYAFGGFAGAGNSPFGYPFANPTTSITLSAGTYSTQAGTYVGPRFRYP